MPKLELRKKTEVDGVVFYSIYKDNEYIGSSTSLDYETTKSMYDKMVNGLQGLEPSVEVLESFDIPETENN